jgi:general secretion pathway protein I
MTRRGFTLLEVLVATTIMAIAVTGLLSSLSTSLRNASRLTDAGRGALLARRKMDELLLDRRLPKMAPFQGPIDPALTGGRSGGWRARVTPFDLGPTPGPNQPILERIELEVWWETGPGQRKFGLEAYRPGVMQ